MERLTVDQQGRLALPHSVAEEIGRRPLELVSSSPRHLFFSAGGDAHGVVFAGRIGEFAIPDLLSFLNMFRKTGVLSFSLAGGVKDLYFDGGEIVYATSTFAQEELGHILLFQGKVEGALLQKAGESARDPIALGKFLVEKKALSEKERWHLTRQMVEEIVYHLFTFHGGSFSYVHRSFSAEEIPRLSLSTQNLIMEGLRRVDERALFMRSIQSLEATVTPTGRPAEGLSSAELRILELLRGEKLTVGKALRRSGHGEFEAMRLLYDLGERKLIEFVQPSAPAEGGGLEEMLSLFNGILGALHEKLSEEGGDFQAEVRAFLLDLPQPFWYVFQEAPLREDGTVDGERILGNLEGLEEGDKEQLLAEALRELVYIECHLLRKLRGAVGSAEALTQVEDVLGRINKLVGRTE